MGRVNVIPELEHTIMSIRHLLSKGVLIDYDHIPDSHSPLICDCEGVALRPGDLVFFNDKSDDPYRFKFGQVERLQNKVRNDICWPFIRVSISGEIVHVQGRYLNLVSKTEKVEDGQSRELCGEDRHESNGILEDSDR